MLRPVVLAPLGLSFLLMSCSSDAGTEPAPVPTRAATVSIGNRPPVAQVSERFLSVAIDTAQVVGAPFWSADGEVSVIGNERRPPYDFTRPKLRKLAAELAPAYLRIGGSTADKTFFDVGNAPMTTPPGGYDELMTKAQWDSIADFATALDYEILFTLNVGPGTRGEDGNWDPTNARVLIEYTKDRQYPVALWELGNEVNGFALLHGPSAALSAEQYAADMATARALVDELDPEVFLAGPSSAYWPLSGEQIPLMDEFLQKGGRLVDVVTWHYYPQQSVRCPLAVRRAGPEVMMQPENLDEVLVWADEVKSSMIARGSSAQMWLGESGNAQCGGEPGVSDTFVGGFWWLDQLGLMARLGQRVVVRQTLSGSNYGMIDEDTLEPNPDYWNSLLWRRLMGTVVLSADKDAEDPMLRTYAHCTRSGAPGYAPGGVTVLLLNLDGGSAVDVELAAFGEGGFKAFVMTSDSLQGKRVMLNGTWLETTEDGTIPPLAPVDTTSVVRIPPHAYAFVVAPEAGMTACQ